MDILRTTFKSSQSLIEFSNAIPIAITLIQLAPNWAISSGRNRQLFVFQSAVIQNTHTHTHLAKKSTQHTSTARKEKVGEAIKEKRTKAKIRKKHPTKSRNQRTDCEKT